MRATFLRSLRLRKAGKLASASLANLVSDAGVRGSVLAVAPVYALELTPSEFGVYGLGASVILGSQHLVSLGTPHFIFFSWTTKDHREALLDTSASLGMLVGRLGALAVVLGLGLTSTLIGVGVGGDVSLVIGISPIVGWANAVLVQVPLAFSRSTRLHRRIGLIGISVGTGRMVGAMALFVWPSLGLAAVIVSEAMAVFAGGVAGWVRSGLLREIRSQGRQSKRDAHTRRRLALSYGVPFLPHAIAQWALTAGDRFIVAVLLGTSAAGTYVLGYQAAQVVQMVVLAVNSAVMPYFGTRSVDERRNMPALRGQARTGGSGLTLHATQGIGPSLITGWALTVSAGGALFGVIGLAPHILQQVDEKFLDVLPVTLLVATGFIGLAQYFVHANTVALALGDTRPLWRWSVAALLANVALNIGLIPLVGVVGAALATLASYLVLAEISGKECRKRLRDMADTSAIVTLQRQRIAVAVLVVGGIAGSLLAW